MVAEPSQDAGDEGRPLSLHLPSQKSISFNTSSVETVADLRGLLQDHAETCFYTNYAIAVGNDVLTDFHSLRLLPRSVNELNMIESAYDEAQSRLHVRRLRQILVSPPAQLQTSSFLTQQREAAESSASDTSSTIDAESFLKMDVPSIHALISDDIVEPAHETCTPQCVHDIRYSRWNGPPGYRALQGDLLYLEIDTLEGNTVFVTGSTIGFFINKSTVSTFDPMQDTQYESEMTLVDLLKRLSPLFATAFRTLLVSAERKHPFATIPVAVPFHHWCAEPKAHAPDMNRSQDAAVFPFGANESTAQDTFMRSWNEEYQSCIELPRETMDDRIQRDRALYRVVYEFVSACKVGSRAIVEGSVTPINVVEPARAHVWVHQNIFYSRSNDGRGIFTSQGGADANYKIASLDLKGIELVNEVGTKGVYTLLTAIVTYRGRRFICQGVIPGILHGDRTSNLMYGFMEEDAAIKPEKETLQYLEPLSRALLVAKRPAKDSQGNVMKNTYTAAETKCILGTDNRRYLIDLVRCTPRDANYTDERLHESMTLRPELIRIFVHAKGIQVTLDKAKKSGSMTAEEQQKVFIDEVSKFEFNVNALTRFEAQCPQLKADITQITEVSTFLQSKVLPSLVQDLCLLRSVPVDSDSISTVFHEHGVNLRYMGNVAKIAANVPFLSSMLRRDMILRSAKNLVHSLLERSNELGETPSNIIASFLNSLVGSKAFGRGMTEKKARYAAIVLKQDRKRCEEAIARDPLLPPDSPDAPLMYSPMSPATRIQSVTRDDGTEVPLRLTAAENVWQCIREKAKTKFDVDFAVDIADTMTPFDRHAILRGVCTAVGIKIACRDYDYTVDDPIRPDDVLDIAPVVKCCFPSSSDAAELLKAGKNHITKGNLPTAYQLLSEALQLLHQIVGPVHPDVAECYAAIALVCFHGNESSQAIENQYRALLIYQRCLGKDHVQVAHAHVNMALFLHSRGEAALALKFAHRALFLLSFTCGPSHPDTAGMLVNVSIILIGKKDFAGAKQLLEESHDRFSASLGAHHVQSASVLHNIALVLSLENNFKEAMKREKQCMKVLEDALGKNHAAVKESHAWLSQFTTNAVLLQSGKQDQVVRSDSSGSPFTWVVSASQLRMQVSMTPPERSQTKEASQTEATQSESPKKLSKGQKKKRSQKKKNKSTSDVY